MIFAGDVAISEGERFLLCGLPSRLKRIPWCIDLEGPVLSPGPTCTLGITAGLPALLSDRTPWRSLDRDGIGCGLPLTDRARFISFIEEMACETPVSETRLKRRVAKRAAELAGFGSILDAARGVFATQEKGR